MFDKKQPYGEVSGKIEDAPGARFFQDGIYYNGLGEKVGGKFAKTPVKPVEETPAPESVTVGVVAKEPEKVVSNEPSKAPVDLSGIGKSTSAPDIKAACEQVGITYTTKPEALKAIDAYVVAALNEEQ